MMIEDVYPEWMRETQVKKIKEILKNVKPFGRVLDVGSGPGFLEEMIPAVAVDINEKYLESIKGEKYLASGDDLPFDDQSFDTIFCIDTVHLLKDISEMVRVLKKDGQLIVTAFCNEYNCDKKLDELKKRFSKLKLIKSFIVKTEKEWDAVAVFIK